MLPAAAADESLGKSTAAAGGFLAQAANNQSIYAHIWGLVK
jgi:hypothetical protein